MVLKEQILYMSRDSLLYVEEFLIFILLEMKSLIVLNYLEMKLILSASLILKHN